jgi:hypothetical protein
MDEKDRPATTATPNDNRQATEKKKKHRIMPSMTTEVARNRTVPEEILSDTIGPQRSHGTALSPRKRERMLVFLATGAFTRGPRPKWPILRGEDKVLARR